MEFDHTTGVKRFTVSRRTHARKETLLDEIKKCEVVCSLCHNDRTKYVKILERFQRDGAFELTRDEFCLAWKMLDASIIDGQRTPEAEAQFAALTNTGPAQGLSHCGSSSEAYESYLIRQPWTIQWRYQWN